MNTLGSAVNVIAFLTLLAGLVLRAAGPGELLVITAWGVLPYAVMVFVHQRVRPAGALAVASVIVSAGIAVFGIWLAVDALFIHFGSKSAGIAVFIAPIYQLPPALIALFLCAVVKRHARRRQTPNPALNRTARKRRLRVPSSLRSSAAG